MQKKKKNGSRVGGKGANGTLTIEFLVDRAKRHAQAGYSKAKWIEFCEVLIRAGFKLKLYEARQTFSKYVTISDGRSEFKVRFSNHKPIRARELQGDCDFFVGVTHTGVRNTSDAIMAVEKAFGIDLHSYEVIE